MCTLLNTSCPSPPHLSSSSKSPSWLPPPPPHCAALFLGPPSLRPLLRLRKQTTEHAPLLSSPALCFACIFSSRFLLALSRSPLIIGAVSLFHLSRGFLLAHRPPPSSVLFVHGGATLFLPRPPRLLLPSSPPCLLQPFPPHFTFCPTFLHLHPVSTILCPPTTVASNRNREETIRQQRRRKKERSASLPPFWFWFVVLYKHKRCVIYSQDLPVCLWQVTVQYLGI